MLHNDVKTTDFESAFFHLTGNPPFPWQVALYERCIAGIFPGSCDLPTGLGKTSVIAVWLIALAVAPERLPRRLVYVVNRRTVVDQTTDEVEKLRRNLRDNAELAELREKLTSLSGIGGARSALDAGKSEQDEIHAPLAISTLRGQFADNREWSADPSRPAVVVGTVDMIGSRLLFSGYGAGFRTRPLYAALLGQDALLVHDEAHLEPAFQELIEEIRNQQINEPAPLGDQFRLRVMELSATGRGSGTTVDTGGPLRLGDADLAHAEVKKRIEATKRIHLVPNADPKKLADEISDLSLKRFDGSGRAVLIFARRVEDVEKIATKLPQNRTRQLTGTLRGLERDRLVENPIFRRFLPGAEPSDETVYLVCTSAGEVGVNISADHMVCDLSTFDSMAQRLGRVNRFGQREDTEVHILHPAKLREDDEHEARLSKTLDLLRQLNGDASPKAISRLDVDARRDAFAPPPITLPVTDILLDAWALTTIREPLPGRPKIEPYLHGIRDEDPPETHVAWRQEVAQIKGEPLDAYGPDDLLEEYPLKPQELLRDRSDRVFKHLTELAKSHPNSPVWLLDNDGRVEVLTLAAMADRDGKERIENRTVLLAPPTGGLRNGMLDGRSDTANDVADELFDDGRRRRIRVRSDDPEFDEKTRGMRLVRRIDFPAAAGNDEDAEGPSWYWFERPRGGDSDGSKSAPEAIPWIEHTDDVVRNAQRFVKTLALPPEFKEAIVLAARLHDLGKKRERWQRGIGNPNPKVWFAKSGKGWVPRDFTAYRHEFGSLLDTLEDGEFARPANQPELSELILHLVAAHHGYARPHFPQECAVDWPEHSIAAAAEMARQVPQRFARLQRKYGRWGLAYLESLLRAADYEASAHPTRTEAGR